MKRWLIIGLALVIALGAAAPFLEADRFRPSIERALERGLGRKVEVGHVHFKLLTGPGFSLDDVRIGEDPRAGIEPFAYVRTLSGEVRLLSLFSRRLEFSSLRLGEASINLVKTDAGPWNFQFFAENPAAAPIAVPMAAPSPADKPRSIKPPSIKMRGGRVNFKFGDTKSVFYFDDADLDVAPASDGSVELRFGGAPARTDQAAQNFGHFFVRGTSRPSADGPQLDFKVELERSPVDDLTRLLDRRGFGVHGIVSLEAALAGPPSRLQVSGSLEIDDVHRWDLLPQRGGGWRFGYAGILDLRAARLDLQTTADVPDPPLVVGLRAWDLLSAPHWDTEAQLKKVPAATLLEVVRHMSGALPEQLAATGSVTGSIRYSGVQGLSGRVELDDASVTLPDAQPLRAAHAVAQMEDNVVSLDAATVAVGAEESAELEGSYSFAKPPGLDLKITTRGLSVAALQSFHLAAIPWLEHTPEGKFRGWARYRSALEPGGAAPSGEWSGEYELLNAQVPIEGLSEPLKVQSAQVSLSGARVAVSKLRARVGKIAFTGEYRYEPAAVRPHRFKLTIPKADSAELERLLALVLTRERGFLARTLGLGSTPPLPAWLKARRADGMVTVGALTVGDVTARVDSARVFWDSALVRLTSVQGAVGEMPFAGDLSVDLNDALPRYRFEGRLQEVAFKGGKLEFEGWMEAEGGGADVAASAHGEGHLEGRSIAFAPDADFRSVSGCFEVAAAGAGMRWKLTGLEVRQGGETLYGAGLTQADGRMMLDLTSRGRQVHFTGSQVALAPD